MPEVFHTITGSDWSRSIAEMRSAPNLVLTQIHNKMNNEKQSQELNSYITAQNKAFEAKCKAEGATWWCVSALTADDLAGYGVHTLAEYKIWQAEQDALNDAKENRKNSY